MKPREPHPDDWKPNPGPQTRFLSLTCFEALYGGAAGGGKSLALLVDAVRYVGRGYGANYHAILFRRTMPELRDTLIKDSKPLYPRLGGVYNKNDHVWTFPGGELVQFGHCQHEDDVHKYQGSEFQYAGFDELTSFLESQYVYIAFSRVRSSKGVPLRVRGATNPGNEGHDWVYDRWGRWLNPEHEDPVSLCSVAHFLRNDEGEEVRCEKQDDGALGRTFIPALAKDNPALKADYYHKLNAIKDPVVRAQLKMGDWLVRPAAGLYFKRAWFSDAHYLDAPPPAHLIVSRVRAWDLGATVDGDWTVGTLEYRLRDGTFVVADVRRMRGTPNDVDAELEATAALDGPMVTQRLPQDPGSAGVHQKTDLQKKLAKWRTVFERPTGEKTTRFGPFSSACQVGNVKIVRAPWNAPWFAELEAFPTKGIKDDQADSVSDAHNHLTGHTTVKQPNAGGSGAPRREMGGW